MKSLLAWVSSEPKSGTPAPLWVTWLERLDRTRLYIRANEIRFAVMLSLVLAVGSLGESTYVVWRLDHPAGRTLYGARVLERYDLFNYEMQVPGSDPYLIKFCPDSPADLEPGMTLEYLIYSERGTCKTLRNGGFKVERDFAHGGKFINFMEASK